MSKFAIAPDPRLSFTYIELAHPAGSLSQDGGQPSPVYPREDDDEQDDDIRLRPFITLPRNRSFRFVDHSFHRVKQLSPNNEVICIQVLLLKTIIFEGVSTDYTRHNTISRMIIKKGMAGRVPPRDRRVRFKVVS